MLLISNPPPFSDTEIEEEVEEEEVEPTLFLDLDVPEVPGLLSREQEQALAYQIRQGGAIGEAARDRFIETNLRLGFKIARRYLHLGEQYGLEYDDIVQEGRIGLIRAVDKFDPGRGYKFSTMATWWIRQAITRALTEYRSSVHVPVHLQDKYRKLQRLAQEWDRQPSAEALAQSTGWTVDCARELLKLHLALDVRSLDEPLADDTEMTHGSLVADPSDMEEQALTNVSSDALRETLQEVLSARELQILELRFGLTGREHTLEETGAKLKVTRERIRQVEAKALHKLRNPRVARILSA